MDDVLHSAQVLKQNYAFSRSLVQSLAVRWCDMNWCKWIWIFQVAEIRWKVDRNQLNRKLKSLPKRRKHQWNRKVSQIDVIHSKGNVCNTQILIGFVHYTHAVRSICTSIIQCKIESTNSNECCRCITILIRRRWRSCETESKTSRLTCSTRPK